MSNEFLDKIREGAGDGFKKTTIEEEKKPWPKQNGQPAMDMYQKGSYLILQAALAGIEVSDVEISVENDIFRMEGKRENPAKQADKFFLEECFWGSFSREIILPVEVDASRTEAEIKSGVLIITIPIIEKGKQKIKIKE